MDNADLEAENAELRTRLQEALAELHRFGSATTMAGGWQKFDELREEQQDAVAAMFSGDFYRGRNFDEVLEIRRACGYFVDTTGSVVCRRNLAQIKNWSATTPFE